MNMILTGANGRLGRLLAKHFADETDHTVLALGRDRDTLSRAMGAAGIRRADRVRCLSNDEFLSGGFSPAEGEHTVIHLAFGRHNRGGAEIASSLVFMERLLERLEGLPGLGKVVYISSQSVYGNASEFRREDTAIAPTLPYAMAKYAGEVLLGAFAARNTAADTLILRLDAVIQSQNLVPALCRNAIRNHRLELRGGGQFSSYIDAEDAALAIAAAAEAELPGAHTFNVGHDRMRVTLSELAALVGQAAEARGIPVDIETTPADIEQWAGMDASAFLRQFGWRPRYDLPRMVRRTFDEVYEKITSSGEVL